MSRYYLESGDYDVNLQLSVQRPVTMVKEGVRVQVKGLSVPLHIWNVDDAVELRVTTPAQTECDRACAVLLFIRRFRQYPRKLGSYEQSSDGTSP